MYDAHRCVHSLGIARWMTTRDEATALAWPAMMEPGECGGKIVCGYFFSESVTAPLAATGNKGTTNLRLTGPCAAERAD